MVTTSVSQQITCRLAVDEQDRARVLSFIREWFWKHHQWVTPPSGGDLLVAYEREEIVGAVNLDFRDSVTPFPLELMYGSEMIRSYFPFFDRERFVQGGRWSATKPNVSRFLLTAIAEHAASRGIEYMLIEAKHYSIERLEQLGIRFIVLYGVRPKYGHLPIERQKYYADDPPPRLAVIKIEQLF